MKIGMTGARTWRPPEQIFAATVELACLCGYRGEDEFHYGDCVGADSQMSRVARDLGLVLVSHPPHYYALRAFTQADIELPPKGHLQRNRDIVDSCDYLIALPDGEERQRSGTWSTVRYARKISRHGAIIYPDGRITGIE